LRLCCLPDWMIRPGAQMPSREQGVNRLAGRAGELADLTGLLDGAVGGMGELVCLVGQPGAGKTALIGALIAAAHKRGIGVLATSIPAGQPGPVAARSVPYLLVCGTQPAPDVLARVDEFAAVEVWDGSGRYPHVAHPAWFAQRLAATAGRSWLTRARPVNSAAKSLLRHDLRPIQNRQ
jgi:hypothetical protein